MPDVSVVHSPREHFTLPRYVKAFDLAFSSNFSWPDGPEKKRVPFEVIDGGHLAITSGEIVACDPFVFLEQPAFTQKVPIGRHPLRIAYARVHGEDGGRVAFARVDFSSAPVTRWELAQIPSDDVTSLKPGEYFGYPVDAGTGCFFDRMAYDSINALMVVNDDGQEYWDVWIKNGEAAGKEKRMRFYLELAVNSHNLIMFESGWGDGVYPSYFGYAADGSVVTLLTDFQVMDWSLAELP